MESDQIEKLYKNYGILADADKDSIKQHVIQYKEILAAVHGSPKERKLACQFIPKFVAQFPDLTNNAINALFDLCEDSDINIRKQAIKELPGICRECPDYTRRVSDILAQLLQVSELSELSAVSVALLSLFKIDPGATLQGIFNQIRYGEDRVRDKCMDFVYKKMRDLPQEMFTSDVQDILIEELKHVLQDASTEEIPMCIDLLLWTHLGKTTLSKKEILDVIVHQLSSEILAVHVDQIDYTYVVDRFLTFVKSARGLFSSEVNSNGFINYCCFHILPQFSSIDGCKEGSGNALELLKIMAELVPFYNDPEEGPNAIPYIFDLLLQYLPLPNEDEEGIPHQKLQFSYVECLLYVLHALLKTSPEFLMSDESNKLKDLRRRLQYFSRASQIYVKKLDGVVKKNKIENLNDMDTKIKVIALKTISNINTLIKDFFHNPPSYKAVIKLSWLSMAKPPNLKRKMIEIIEKSNASPVEKPPRPTKFYQMALYKPPSGKYSSRVFDSKNGKPGWLE